MQYTIGLERPNGVIKLTVYYIVSVLFGRIGSDRQSSKRLVTNTEMCAHTFLHLKISLDKLKNDISIRWKLSHVYFTANHPHFCCWVFSVDDNKIVWFRISECRAVVLVDIIALAKKFHPLKNNCDDYFRIFEKQHFTAPLFLYFQKNWQMTWFCAL